MIDAELILKEEVKNFKFIEVPKGDSDLQKDKLFGSVRLGNEFKTKVFITFLTNQGPKKIETTVWTVTEKYLQIKSGVLIPLNSIVRIVY